MARQKPETKEEANMLRFKRNKSHRRFFGMSALDMVLLVAGTIVIFCSSGNIARAQDIPSPAVTGEDQPTPSATTPKPSFVPMSQAVTPKINYTVGMEYRENYLVSTGQLFHEDPVLQGFCGVSFANGWYIEPWISGAREGGYGNEFDLTIQKSFETAPGFGVDWGVLYYRLNDDLFVNIIQPQVRIRWTIGQFQTLAELKYAQSLRSEAPDGGWIIETSARRPIPLGKHFEFVAQANVIGDFNGAFGFDSAMIVQLRPAIAWKVDDAMRVELRYRESLLFWNNDDRRNEGSWSVAAVRSF